jgi:hypothetical protein
VTEVVPRQYSWWTPTRWERQPSPWQYRAVEEANIDLSEAMEAAGYTRVTTIGNAGDFVTEHEINVWSSGAPVGHYYVELWDGNAQLAEFFVASEYRVAFFIDKLPEIAGSFGQHELAAEARLLRRALVAFVRHGHGESTISEDGEQSYDDAVRTRWRLAERRAAQARKEQSAL